MPSVVMGVKDLATIEAAMELVKDNKKVFAGLAKIAEKWARANQRSSGMTYGQFTVIANEEMGLGNWRVPSVAILVRALRDAAATEDHVRVMLRNVMATRPKPWTGLEWEVRKMAKVLEQANGDITKVENVEAQTGVLQNL